MILSPADILYRNLGIQTVVNETSKKEKFLRKKYIGVLRWESTSVRVIIIKFPVTLKRQMRNRKMKSRICSCGSFVSPRRMKVVIAVWFFTTEFWNLSNWQGKIRDFMRRLVYESCTKTLCNYSQTNQSTFTYPFTSVYISLCLHIGLHLVSPSHYNQDHHCSDSLSEFTSLREDYSFRIYVIIKPTLSKIIVCPLKFTNVC